VFILLHDITLENYLYWPKQSNFKDHYGDVVITQCPICFSFRNQSDSNANFAHLIPPQKLKEERAKHEQIVREDLNVGASH